MKIADLRLKEANIRHDLKDLRTSNNQLVDNYDTELNLFDQVWIDIYSIAFN